MKSILVSFLAIEIAVLAQSGAAGQITLKQVLAWLPVDTETVIGSNGPFRILHTAHEFDQFTADELQLSISNHPLTLLGLDELGLGEALQNETVALAIEGSRRFRSPAALGPMLYEGCEIAIFTSDLRSQRDTFMTNARGSGAQIIQIEATSVAAFKVGIEDDSWTILVAFPTPRVILVATDTGYLQEVLRRIKGGTGPRALPDSLPEWSYLRTDSSLWALRHFSKLNIDEDPSTPFAEQRAANIPDKDAIGIVVYFEARREKMAHVIYLSGTRAREVLREAISAGQHPAGFGSVANTPTSFKDLTPGIVECSIPLASPQVVVWLLFILGGMLGHATYL